MLSRNSLVCFASNWYYFYVIDFCKGISRADLSCIGFIDGTLHPIARPGYGVQESCYNGKDCVHGLKYLGVAIPDGLIAYLYGAIEGRHHDSYLYTLSGLLLMLRALLGSGSFSLFGDVAFPLSDWVITSYRDDEVTYLHQQRFNRAHKAVRVAVEWAFGKIQSHSPQLLRKETQQVFRSPLKKMYYVATLFANAHTCLYGNQTSTYFAVRPISLEQYFINY